MNKISAFIKRQAQNIFQKGPGILNVIRKSRIHEEPYDICPHCSSEIGEKELFYDEKGYYGEPKTWCHRKCGGSILFPEDKKSSEGKIFYFKIKILSNKMPDYLKCHPECGYLDNRHCILFNEILSTNILRCKQCVSAVEGLI